MANGWSNSRSKELNSMLQFYVDSVIIANLIRATRAPQLFQNELLFPNLHCVIIVFLAALFLPQIASSMHFLCLGGFRNTLFEIIISRFH